MTLNAEYQTELQKTYIKGKSVPELTETARILIGQIEDPDEFLPIRLDAFIMVARTLEASFAKFAGPWTDGGEQARWDLARRWIGRDKEAEAHKCGALCPEHGDPRDTNIAPIPQTEYCPECGAVMFPPYPSKACGHCPWVALEEVAP